MLGPKKQIRVGYYYQRVAISNAGHHSRIQKRYIRGMQRSYYKIWHNGEVIDRALTVKACRRIARNHKEAKL